MPLHHPVPFAGRIARTSMLLASVLGIHTVAAQTVMPASRYARAEQMFAPNADKLVLGDQIAPRWIGGTDRFWYRVTTARGSAFMYVDPAKRLRRPAFDHARLAAELARAADTVVVADSLPFTTLEWKEEGKESTLQVTVRGKPWLCRLSVYRCEAGTEPKVDPKELLSPDKQWAIYLQDHNLWIRNTKTDERRALTTDGTARNDYGSMSQGNTSAISRQRMGMPERPVALWSPDSRRILTHQLDQRQVPEAYLLQSVRADSVRPKLWSFAFPFPGDSVAMAHMWVFEAESGRATRVNTPALQSPYDSPIAMQDAWWGDSTGTTAYLVSHGRGFKTWTLFAVDAATGAARSLGEEQAETFAELSTIGGRPDLHVLSGGKEVIWPSERDGWNHLYLVDGATGQVMRQITRGSFVVRQLLKVDEKARKLWFVASGREPGRDPYLQHLYSINFDGSGLTLLTPEDAEHEITLGAKGDWVVDRASRADLAPVTILRSLDGKVAMPLEQADVSRLLATGWRWPERFTTKAEDGVTDIYGVIYTPSDFDPAKRYPVVEEIYPGPQINKVPKAFAAGGDHRALVELGMVGVEVDGRGTPFRSKTFHNYSYGHLENGGALEDHVAAYKQLAPTRPYMDLGRVGIYGHSGGGFASARAMFLYPEFYKVAVSSAGNHDQRGYLSLWGELYQGLPQGDNYAAQANASIAKRLQGKLMLAYGDLDDNVSPALTLQVIDALTRANKSYDLLIIPNGAHAFAANMYFRRRRWDYFVEHLMGVTPPSDYLIRTAPERPPVTSGTAPEGDATKPS